MGNDRPGTKGAAWARGVRIKRWAVSITLDDIIAECCIGIIRAWLLAVPLARGWGL